MSNERYTPHRSGSKQGYLLSGRAVEATRRVVERFGPMHRPLPSLFGQERRQPGDVVQESSAGGGIGEFYVPASSGVRTVWTMSDPTKANVHYNQNAEPPMEETNEPVPGTWGPGEKWWVKAYLTGPVIV